MSPEKLILGVVFVGILCLTGLIAQCSHNVSECRIEAIKAGVKSADVMPICRA